MKLMLLLVMMRIATASNEDNATVSSNDDKGDVGAWVGSEQREKFYIYSLNKIYFMFLCL